MELSRLASKQKRYHDLTAFAATEVSDSRLRKGIELALSRYRTILSECWKKQAITLEDTRTIDSIERELDSLSNAARLRTSSP
jgi:hypothetical protein